MNLGLFVLHFSFCNLKFEILPPTRPPSGPPLRRGERKASVSSANLPSLPSETPWVPPYERGEAPAASPVRPYDGGEPSAAPRPLKARPDRPPSPPYSR